MGHWGGNTEIGAIQKQAIVTVVERKSSYAVVAKVYNKTTDLIGAEIVDRLKQFGTKAKTLTFDNGKEFCGHGKLDEALGSRSYFARLFASWERGSNENFNGLLSQFVPKKHLIESIADEEIKMNENRLNNQTRKQLEFRTPEEVFHQSLRRVALRP